MKLISLNIWGGRIYKPLIEFIKKSADIDIFCFQEVFNGATTTRSVHTESVMDIFSKIADTLPGHQGIFVEEQTNEEGQAIFLRRNIKIIKTGEEFVFRFKNAMENNDSRTLGRVVQYCQIENPGREYLIGNFHGLWNGQGKIDTPDRISQSKKIKEFLDRFNLPKVLVGDFNLLPSTESIKIIETDMCNLIKDFDITSTRSELYKRGNSQYADYTFISPEIIVKDFKVLQDVISDHLPLYLEFE